MANTSPVPLAESATAESNHWLLAGKCDVSCNETLDSLRQSARGPERDWLAMATGRHWVGRRGMREMGKGHSGKSQGGGTSRPREGVRGCFLPISTL